MPFTYCPNCGNAIKDFKEAYHGCSECGFADYMTIEELMAKELGELVKKKGQAYGNSIPTVERILHLLYPDGIDPTQYLNASCLVRLLDKVKRIATNNDPYGESPWWDIAGYGLRMAIIERETQNERSDGTGNPDSTLCRVDDVSRVLKHHRTDAGYKSFTKDNHKSKS